MTIYDDLMAELELVKRQVQYLSENVGTKATSLAVTQLSNTVDNKADESELNSLRSTVDSISSTVAGNSSGISTLNSEVATLTGEISSVTNSQGAAVIALNAEISRAQTAEASKQSISTLEAAVAAKVGTGGALDTALENSYVARIEQFQSYVTGGDWALAVNAALSAGMRTILFPGSFYAMKTPITVPKNAGASLVSLNARKGTTLSFNIPTGNSTRAAIEYLNDGPSETGSGKTFGFAGIHIEGLHIQGNNSVCHGISLKNTSYACTNRVTVDGFKGAGLLLEDVWDSDFDIEVQDCGRTTTSGYPSITGSTTLSSALSTSGAITSLPVAALTGSIASGQTVIITSGSNTQSFIASSAVSTGSTAIPVTSQTPNFAYPSGSTVATPSDPYSDPIWRSTNANTLFSPIHVNAVTSPGASSTNMVRMRGEWEQGKVSPLVTWNDINSIGIVIKDLHAEQRATSDYGLFDFAVIAGGDFNFTDCAIDVSFREGILLTGYSSISIEGGRYCKSLKQTVNNKIGNIRVSGAWLGDVYITALDGNHLFTGSILNNVTLDYPAGTNRFQNCTMQDFTVTGAGVGGSSLSHCTLRNYTTPNTSTANDMIFCTATGNVNAASTASKINNNRISGTFTPPTDAASEFTDDWHNVTTFSNGWTSFGSPYATNVTYRREGRLVRVRGNIKSGSLGSSAFTLPAGYRPAVRQDFAVSTTSADGYVIFNADGTVIPQSPSVASSVGLDVTFSVS